MGLNPKEANNSRARRRRDGAACRAVRREGRRRRGRRDRLRRRDAAEEKYFAAQIELAKDAGLPILIHTPHRDKKRGTERTLALVKESGIAPELMLIDHNNEETLPLVLDIGLLGRPLDLPEHQDGRAAHGRRSCKQYGARAHADQLAPPTGA